MRVGPSIGPAIGRFGVREAGSAGYSLDTVARDATSGIYCPEDTAQWEQVIGVAGLTGTVLVPDALWLCQEGSGALTDSIGTYDLAVSGTGHVYGVAVSGWTRTGVRVGENTSNRWHNTSVHDFASNGGAMISYSRRLGSSASAVRQLLGLGTTTQAYVGGGTSPLRAVSGANAVAGADGAGAVRPHGIVFDRAGTRTVGFDDQQKLTPTHAATVTGARVSIGGGVAGSAADSTLYAWLWLVPPSDADIKTILETLGWTIAWS